MRDLCATCKTNGSLRELLVQEAGKLDKRTTLGLVNDSDYSTIESIANDLGWANAILANTKAGGRDTSQQPNYSLTRT